MPVRPSPHPTEAELEILQVLWDRGPSTVRQVHETLQANRKTRLTTTLKLIQMMVEKGQLIRSDERPAIFRPSVPQERTRAGLLEDLAQKAFGGSMQKLLVHAMKDADLSDEELSQLQKLIGKAKDNKGTR